MATRTICVNVPLHYLSYLSSCLALELHQAISLSINMSLCTLEVYYKRQWMWVDV